MSASMRRLSVQELIEILEKMDKKDFVGYVFTVQESYNSEQHQSIMLYRNLPGINI